MNMKAVVHRTATVAAVVCAASVFAFTAGAQSAGSAAAGTKAALSATRETTGTAPGAATGATQTSAAIFGAGSAALAQPPDYAARYGGGPPVSTPEEMQVTNQLNKQAINGTTESSAVLNGEAPAENAPIGEKGGPPYQPSPYAQYNAQEQQYQSQMQQYENQQQHYQYERQRYANELGAYRARYEWGYARPYPDGDGYRSPPPY